MNHIKYIVFLVLALSILFVAGALSLSLCMWGCPKSLYAYSIQAIFFIALILVIGVIYAWVKAVQK